MPIRIGYSLTYDFDVPTPMIVMLNVHYSRASDLLAPDTMITSPSTPYLSFRDLFGNWCNRLLCPSGRFQIRAETTIRDAGLYDEVATGARQHRVEELPEEALVFLLPSRYCESDKLSDEAWQLFSSYDDGWDRVQAISLFVHELISFGYQWARSTRTAAEAFVEGQGVCRDYAHLGVALTRAMNIPARYCTGYLADRGIRPAGDPPDFSAWYEVYLDGRWLTVDPRKLCATHGQDPDRPRSRRRRRRHYNDVWTQPLDRLPGDDRRAERLSLKGSCWEILVGGFSLGPTPCALLRSLGPQLG